MEKLKYANTRLAALVLLRFLIGWHLLYEGIAKALNPQWSASGFLKESQWILSGFADWIVSNPAILSAVDFLNTWGLVAVGLGVILGFFFKTAATAGALLLFVYYLSCPPLAGLEYALPADGNNLIVDKTLIEAIALVVLALYSTSTIFGIDALIQQIRKKGETVW